MVGWSRGAVTCLMTAHKLFEIFDYTINVNIFAADPVPGGMTTITDNMCHITPNVRNLFVILATGDARSNFVPLDRKTIRILTPRFNDPLYIAPHVHMLPMPGNHTDIVLGYQPSCWGVVPGGLIVRHLAWKFLKFHGTQFEPQWEKGESPDWKPDILVHYYELMMKNAKNNFEKAKYVALLDKIAAGRELTRDVHLYRNHYVTDEKKHMNEHHRFCLSKSFPRPLPYPPPPAEIPKDVLKARAQVTGAPYLSEGRPPKQATMTELGISYK
jgi:hypothetical protein